MSTRRINSWEQLQAEISQILARLNEQPELALAAAVNPLFALEELGYEIEPQVRPLIEDRLRFDHRTAVERRRLRQTIAEIAGEDFEIDSPRALRRILFEKLGIPIPQTAYKQASQASSLREIDLNPPRPRASWLEPQEDALEILRGKHSIIEPLIEYRRLGTLAPQLAPRPLYEEVRSGKRRLPLKSLSGRLQSSQEKGPASPTPSEPETTPGEKVFDLNQASAADLQTIAGVGEKLAQRIVDYRLAFGAYESVEDLKKVRGIGNELFGRLRPYFRVGGSKK